MARPCPVLPGGGDGPPTVDETVALARTQVAAGVTRVTATPHVTWDIPTTSQQVIEGVASVNHALREAEIPLEVLTGGEIAITRAADLDDDELRALALGGGRRSEERRVGKEC